MAETSPTAEMWTQRVAEWRASGERAEAFSRREGFAASTLRWWASKLKRDMTETESEPTTSTTSTKEVRVARVVRTESKPACQPPPLIIEVGFADVRITVAAGTNRATLAMVLELIGLGVDQ